MTSCGAVLTRLPSRITFSLPRRPAARTSRARPLQPRARIMSLKTDHAQRTANEPRDPSLHKVTIAAVDDVNSTVRVFRLDASPTANGIKFLPGQWLDVFVPGISKPGGFTITSPPSKAAPAPNKTPPATTTTTTSPPYLELAVQKSPTNPVAEWLWQQPASRILASELRVRVGGSFVWPPPGIIPMTLRKLVFVAGGVGVNPLMSIVSHLAERADPRYTIEFLYSMRDPGEGRRHASEMLFLERLAGIFSRDGGDKKIKGRLRLFLTGGAGEEDSADGDATIAKVDLPFRRRRITADDVSHAVGEDKRFSVVYVCGVPSMTDELVDKLTSPEGLGLDKHRVLYEKWW